MQKNPDDFPSLDSILESYLSLDTTPGRDRDNERPVSWWIPVAQKEKYDLLQTRSRNLFGRALREIILKSIDQGLDILDQKKNKAS